MTKPRTTKRRCEVCGEILKQQTKETTSQKYCTRCRKERRLIASKAFGGAPKPHEFEGKYVIRRRKI